MGITGCFLLLVITFFHTNQVEAQGRGSVRLFNNGSTSPNNTAGTIEVYYNNQWGTICRSNCNNDTATVVCHQLGYSRGYERNGSYGSVTSQPAIDTVVCSTSNLVILQCLYNHVNPTCSSANFLKVHCYSTPIWNNPYSGMVRLQDGPYAGMGRVEVYCNGQWGAICDDSGFDDNAANTVCTELGYTNASSTSPIAYSGHGKILLSQSSCKGTYSCLSECVVGYCPASSETCSGHNVVNVTCSYIESGGFIIVTCGSSSSSGVYVAGIVITCFVAFVCCVLIFIALPICICCCLGMDIRPAASNFYKRFTYSNI